MSQPKSNLRANCEKYSYVNSGSSLGYMSRGQQISPALSKNKRHTVHIDYVQQQTQNHKNSVITDQNCYLKRNSVNDDLNDMMSSLDISSSTTQNATCHDFIYSSLSVLKPVFESNKASSAKGLTKVSATPQLNKLPVPLKKPRPTSYQSPIGIFDDSSMNLMHSLHANGHNNQVKRNSTFIPVTNFAPSKAGSSYEKNDLYASRATPSLLPIPIVSKNVESSRSPTKYTPIQTMDTRLGTLPSDDKHVKEKAVNTHKRGSNSISIGAERFFGKIWNGNSHNSSRSLSIDKNNKNVSHVAHVDLLIHAESETMSKLNIKNKSSKASKQKKMSMNINEKNNGTARVMEWFTRRRKIIFITNNHYKKSVNTAWYKKHDKVPIIPLIDIL
ncbi:unnamed protein product [Pneumocystis jirovecii]|uniref:Uncharacterized protein n=1 Tax=Pneumocystis jirovecii TaxID=42068 RepID=L0P9X9_PNEJI|nr:unnamed protein product [Pneumocystis jirovecii]